MKKIALKTLGGRLPLGVNIRRILKNGAVHPALLSQAQQSNEIESELVPGWSKGCYRPSVSKG